MVFEKPYQHQPDALASFDFVDIQKGTGTNVYYGAKTNLSGANTTILIDEIIPSGEISEEVTADTDFTWDLEAFNKPLTMRGTIRYSQGFWNSTAGGAYVRVKVQHIDGITSAVTDVTNLVLSDGLGTNSGHMVLLELPVIAQKTFKKGDVLRLFTRIEIVTASTIEMGHDPSGRDGTNVTAANGLTTQMSLLVPFNLDI